MTYRQDDPSAFYQKAVDGDPVWSLAISRDNFLQDKVDSSTRLRIATSAAGAVLVDPSTFLCPNGSCPIVEDGRTLFKDKYHLRSSAVRGSRFAFLDRYLLADPPNH